MTRLPKEARDSLMRAWIALLEEKHPGVTWIPVDTTDPRSQPATKTNADATSAQTTPA